MASFRTFLRTAALAASAVTLLGASAAYAQRDPAYAAARAAGQVGEKMDGYLGIVGAPTGALDRMVDDLNAQRKQVYVTQAQTQHSTVQEYAFTAGCLAIARTVPGEKYQAPDGSWKTRGSGPAERDARCI